MTNESLPAADMELGCPVERRPEHLQLRLQLRQAEVDDLMVQQRRTERLRYCLSQKSCPNLYCNLIHIKLQYKMSQDFLDIK